MSWRSQPLYGQVKLVAQGKVSGDAIKLRLAINETTEWQGLLKAGFIIERETIIKDSQRVLPIKSTILGTVRTAELEKWEKAYHQNDFAAVAAQSLFGDELKVSLFQNQLIRGIQKAEIINQRRDLLNYCADNSWETALLSGLAFTDSTAIPQEKYLYKFYQAQKTDISVDTAYVFIGLSDSTRLPIGPDPFIKSNKSGAMLMWEKLPEHFVYSSFIVEKSIDGRNYKALSDISSVTLSNEYSEGSIHVVNIDGTEKNTYFRVVGRDIFGDLGPASEAVRLEHWDEPDLSQFQFTINHGTEGETVINWPVINAPGYSINILRAVKANGQYIKINEVPLEIDSGIFRDQNPNISNYYKLQVHNESDLILTTLPQFIQRKNLIPPPPPVDVAGQIDSTGNVIVSWKPPKENNILGYKVYASNFEDGEFFDVSNGITAGVIFREKLALNSSNENRYYYVLTVDERLNMSVCSDTIVTQKPVPFSHSSLILHSIRSSRDTTEVRVIAYENLMNIKFDLVWRTPNETVLSQLINVNNGQIIAQPIDFEYEQILLRASQENQLLSELVLPITTYNSNYLLIRLLSK